jgi:hypothetical protein
MVIGCLLPCCHIACHIAISQRPPVLVDAWIAGLIFRAVSAWKVRKSSQLSIVGRGCEHRLPDRWRLWRYACRVSLCAVSNVSRVH